MVNIFTAFITGLTTGGLSCLAVQGGLLASSLAGQVEKDLAVARPEMRRKKKTGSRQAAQQPNRLALPILAFLAAKLLAYTILGFLLGLAGSMFQLSPLTRAILQVAIGIFMIGSALRMLNVHPIFRFFAFEPPAFLRRKIRKTASSSASVAAPIFLGFLTVLIPCGITQAMMAVALSTANPVEGAVIMFAFTLGASPVFFAVAYFATRLGSKLEKHFMRFVAIVLLVLGVFSIDTGLTLAGSPVSLMRGMSDISSQPEAADSAATEEPGAVEQQAAEVQTGEELQEFNPDTFGKETPVADAENNVEENENVITVNVVNYGYEPRVVHAKAGVSIKLKLVSEDVYSCSLAFVVPSLGFQQILEPTGEAWVEIPAQEKGTRMPFSCSMGMFTGGIIFDL